MDMRAVVGFLAVVTVAFAGAAPAPGAKSAKVSEWGFDPVDSTKFMQAAFDSDVPTIVIDRQAGPWIVGPIQTAKSGKRIVFEPCVEVQALRGDFRHNDSLFRFNGVTGLRIVGNGGKLRMWREDYADRSKYSFSEHRHALMLLSCRDVRIEGLTCEGSGGDGIYVGVDNEDDPDPVQPKDIVIRDCICDRNYRQGISVISCENLLIENTVLSNTKGAAPEAGIDFEPNRSHAILSNCVMRNCRMFGNASSAVDISINSPCRPISITIENCASDGDLRSFHYDGWHLNPRLPDPGFVKFVGCSFRNEQAPGDVKVYPTYPLTVEFEKCLFLNNCTENPSRPEIEVYSPLSFEPPRPYVRLTDCFVRRRADGDWLSRTADGSRLAGGFAGRFVLERGGRRELVQLESRTQLPPTVLFDPSKVRKIADPQPGVMRSTGSLSLRHGTRLVFYADRARDVRIKVRQDRVGKSALSTVRGEFRTVGGKLLGRPAAPTEAGDEIVLKAPAKGFYTVSWRVRVHGLTVLGADVPVALDLSEAFAYQAMIAAIGEAWLQVPANTPFVLFGCGEGSRERWSLAVDDPTGLRRAREGAIADWVACGPLSCAKSGLWKLTFGRPDRNSHEDALLGLVGVPAQLFLDRERYWK